METIIYFYQNRNAVDFVTEKWKEDDYCLIRAGVPPFVWKKERAGEKEKQEEQGKGKSQEGWEKGREQEGKGKERRQKRQGKGRKQESQEKGREQEGQEKGKKQERQEKGRRQKGQGKGRKQERQEKGREQGGQGEGRRQEEQKNRKHREFVESEKLSAWWGRLRERQLITPKIKWNNVDDKNRKTLSNREKPQTCNRLQVMDKIREREELLEQWKGALRLLAENPYRTYCVYEESLHRIWDAHWDVPEYTDFRKEKWIERLMEHAIHSHFIVLGVEDCIPGILYSHSRQLRAVRWILREEEFDRTIQNFLDSFYEETGIAIEIHLLDKTQPWWRVCLAGTVAADVLDFSRESRVPAGGLMAGSVWLDMDSKGDMERRMEAVCPQIFYFSMKKEWRRRQKEPVFLDTAGKNGYNT